MSLPTETEVVVIGAGPAGLAVAACLQRSGISYVLIEKAERVGSAWRSHYDRLHLHTHRVLSGLPYFPMSRHFSRYPSRQEVVDYLEAYTAAMRLNPYLGVSVENVHSESRRWITDTSAGKISSRAVVVATGYNGEPVIPCWPGLKEFPGSMLHSSAYQNGTSFVDQDVLVVGFGNSGGEIALDLMEQGARPTISVRNPVNIIPRDVLGIPILAIGIALSKLPSRLADALSWPLLKLYYPSYQKLGLRKAAGGPFTQIAKIHKVPLLDIGTIREIRNGRIKVTGAIQSFKGEKVLFADGMEKDFQAIVLATGFRPGSMSILPTSVSVQNGVETNLSGLFLCGFHVSSAGMLREIGMEAKRIVASITRTPE